MNVWDFAFALADNHPWLYFFTLVAFVGVAGGVSQFRFVTLYRKRTRTASSAPIGKQIARTMAAERRDKEKAAQKARIDALDVVSTAVAGAREIGQRTVRPAPAPPATPPTGKS